ncbi:hsp70 nucleotide exchange factor FES1-like [Magnolia sinica]|uniref:hsp70 nucleotide exchange factor FES1-like n=1 Tax=Magnolia sinica TaxID=86752 RepID=UPI002659EAFB|nr:hsp70 nucleotide exchange factor FES1-like [Magnolia sinica]
MRNSKRILISMGKAWKTLLLLSLLSLSLTIAHIQEKGEESDEESPTVAEEHNEFEGAFSSLDGMLQWAISHSDPTRLKEKAHDVQGLSADELMKLQLETKELVEKLKVPSDAELMQAAITDLNNSSLSLEDLHRALDDLLILVESIDNANGLNKLGGLVAVIRKLNSSELEIRTASAWILGKASQNNPVVQKQILELGALPNLMMMVKSSFTGEALKALYAVSAVISNNVDGQELFYSEAGDFLLQDVMSNSSTDVRLLRKSAILVADLAQCILENGKEEKLPFINDRIFLKSLVNLTASTDLDLQEKVLMAIRNLLQLTSTKELVSNDLWGLDEAMVKMRERLEDLMEDEHRRDYARDVESLRKEVELIFHSRLDKVT